MSKDNLSDMKSGAKVNPQGAVDVTDLRAKSKTVGSGEEVKTEIPHGDIADIRADDPPFVVAQKVAAAREKVAGDSDTSKEDLQKAQLAALDPGQNSTDSK